MMVKRFVCFVLSFFLFILYPFNYGRANLWEKSLSETIDTFSYISLGSLVNGVLTIRDSINLNQKMCIIPEGICLNFDNGLISNGTLVGNMTKMKCKKACLNRVRIKGTWYAPIIKTSYFCDLSYDNALKDVLALSHPLVKNKITIDEGKYQVSAYKNGDVCIPICSNTELEMNGVISLTPNDYKNYYIIQLSGSNISIKGRGTIEGDKHTHIGKSGEWGMGVNLDDAHHVTICGLTVKDCWGDCIYVGKKSSDVTIKKCYLIHGRRQGISITSADGVTIKNCIITNVKGTNPEYAIDVEPNKNESVDNIFISGVDVKDCQGGFLVYGKAHNAYVGNVSIKNCHIESAKKVPISIIKCSSAKVENCIIKGGNQRKTIYSDEVASAIIKNNREE